MDNTPSWPEIEDISFDAFEKEHGNPEPTHDVPPSRLLFRTAAALAASTPVEPVWIVKPWVAAVSTTELSGKIKTAGKTTFVLSLCHSIVVGEPFLGEPVAIGRVVYLTEQPDASFRVAFDRAGLSNSEAFEFLSFHLTGGKKWPDIVQGAIDRAIDIKASLICVDTLGQFAGLRGSAENDAGSALEAMLPLQTAAAKFGLGVLVIRHDRKGAQLDVGESSRGSSAFAGAVDIVMNLRRPDSRRARTGQRLIQSLSRFDETPASLLIELVDGEYRSLGDAATLARQAQTMILKNLSELGGQTLDEICRSAEITRTVAQEAIQDLTDSKMITRTGVGKRGSPYRYTLISAAAEM